jgi:hypothetical protein
MARTLPTRSARRGFGRTFLRGLLWTVLAAGVLYGLVWWRVDAGISKQLKALEPFAEIQRGRSFFTLDGEFGVSRLEIAPRLPGAGATRLRSGRVAIETPGLWWLMKAGLFGPPEQLPRRMGLSVANLELDGAPTGPESGFIGAYSALPFEAAGCGTNSFNRLDLVQMGLPDTDTVLAARFEHSDAGIFNLSIDLGTAGVGRMEWRMGIALPPTASVGAGEVLGGRLVNLSLAFIDEGFVAARNGWCTDRVTTSLKDFNDLHSDAVRALLRTVGLQPDVDLLKAYAKFAADGGEFRIETRPSSAQGLAALAAMELDDLRQALAPYVRVTGTDPVRFAFAKVRAMSLRDQLFAAEVARARMEDGVPLDPEIEEVVGEPPRIPEPQPERQVIPLPASDGRIDYSQLGPYLGREIEVVTIWGSRRRGELVSHAQARLLLRLPPSQGGFDLTVPAETVQSVRVLDAAAIQPDSSPDLTDAQAN